MPVNQDTDAFIDGESNIMEGSFSVTNDDPRMAESGLPLPGQMHHHQSLTEDFLMLFYVQLIIMKINLKRF
jgi:hypothetical protein